MRRWPLWHVPAQIVSLSESLHQELAGTDVHVHLVCPGFVNTKFLEPALSLIPANLHKESRIVRRAMPCCAVPLHAIAKAMPCWRGPLSRRYNLLRMSDCGGLGTDAASVRDGMHTPTRPIPA